MNFKSESGQALILLVLGVVALLGFTALAVDGGMVYSDRRNAQMGTDAASLAGGGEAAIQMEDRGITYQNFNCGSGSMAATLTAAETTAIERAADNHYTLDLDVSDKNGVDAVCGITGFDKYVDIKTWVTADTETSFIQFVYSGAARNTVHAITRVRPRSPAAFGHAIVALNPADCQGQQNGAGFHGSEGTFVQGGGIFSNGCLQADGNAGDITVDPGNISYVGEVDDSHNLFDPPPQQVTETIDSTAFSIEEPNCDDPAAWNGSGPALKSLGTLGAGLYCVTGELRLNAGDVFSGTGITIKMVDGGLRINGGALVQITAPVPGSNASPAIPGVLIYAPASNHEEIQLNGNSDSFFTGTVYAPGADINLLGNGEMDAFHSQLIGWNVEIGGNADAYVLFDANEQYSRPAAIELYK